MDENYDEGAYYSFHFPLIDGVFDLKIKYSWFHAVVSAV